MLSLGGDSFDDDDSRLGRDEGTEPASDGLLRKDARQAVSGPDGR